MRLIVIMYFNLNHVFYLLTCAHHLISYLFLLGWSPLVNEKSKLSSKYLCAHPVLTATHYTCFKGCQ